MVLNSSEHINMDLNELAAFSSFSYKLFCLMSMHAHSLPQIQVIDSWKGSFSVIGGKNVLNSIM